MRITRPGLAAAALLCALHGGARASESGDDSDAGVDLFGRVYETIRSSYVHPVSGHDLARAAIDGMVGSLDPHSAYLTEAEYQAREAALDGHFAGIGVTLQQSRGAVSVVAPVPGSPAAHASLQPGDRILRVEGQSVAGLSLDQVVARLKGEAGTQVGFAVQTGTGAVRELRLMRQLLHVPVVQSALLGRDAYIRLTSFDVSAGAEVAAAWADLVRRAGAPPAGLVLDLRDNPGGEVDQAVAVADLFVRDGGIVSIRGRTPADNARWQARGQDVTGGAPIVVLADAMTASASEIVEGALQDHHRAAILGTRSYGKGSVQVMLPLDGDGALVLTTALYYTPSGRSIQARGITPDVVVHETRDEPDVATPEETALPHAFDAVDPLAASAVSPWHVIAARIPARPPASWPAFDATRPATDFQLQQGLKLLGLMATTVTASR